MSLRTEYRNSPLLTKKSVTLIVLAGCKTTKITTNVLELRKMSTYQANASKNKYIDFWL